MAAPASGERRAEIYTYEAQWLIYAMGWSVRVAMPIAPTGGATLRDLHSTIPAPHSFATPARFFARDRSSRSVRFLSSPPPRLASDDRLLSDPPSRRRARHRSPPRSPSSGSPRQAVSCRRGFIRRAVQQQGGHRESRRGRGCVPGGTDTLVHAPVPCTKILFIPDKECTKDDLIATTGDYLRIWNIKDEGVSQVAAEHNKNSEFCAPLTSFD